MQKKSVARHAFSKFMALVRAATAWQEDLLKVKIYTS